MFRDYDQYMDAKGHSVPHFGCETCIKVFTLQREPYLVMKNSKTIRIVPAGLQSVLIYDPQTSR